jgi:DNA-binding XRE family transcriptional regulator
MTWDVLAAPEFEAWLTNLPEESRKAVAIDLEVLRMAGPQLGRPLVDHIKGSKHANMKELRTASGIHVYRTQFAFDPIRRAVLLIGGDKAGQNQDRFYKTLIKQADAILDRHLALLKPCTPEEGQAMKKLDTVLGHLFSAEERADIRQRAKEKLAGLRLQRLREARHLTQEEAARAMGVSQAALSKLERRTNVTIGVLQRYVEAIGGRLEVSVVLPTTGGSRPRRGARANGKRVHLVTA